MELIEKRRMLCLLSILTIGLSKSHLQVSSIGRFCITQPLAKASFALFGDALIAPSGGQVFLVELIGGLWKTT